jgi:DNA-binding NtrC family response regulator
LDDIPPEYVLPTLNRMANRVAKRTQRRGEGERGLYFLAREQFERYIVRLMVNRFRGDKEAAARALGIGLSTLKEKLRNAPKDLQDDL